MANAGSSEKRHCARISVYMQYYSWQLSVITATLYTDNSYSSPARVVQWIDHLAQCAVERDLSCTVRRWFEVQFEPRPA